MNAPVLKTQLWPHYLLGFVALALLLAARVPRFASYADLITVACGVFGLGTFAACKVFLGPRVWSIVESFSPTPIVPPSMQPTVVEEVKP